MKLAILGACLIALLPITANACKVEINLDPSSTDATFHIDDKSLHNSYDWGFVPPGKVSIKVSNCQNTSFHLLDKNTGNQKFLSAQKRLKETREEYEKAQKDLDKIMKEHNHIMYFKK